MSYSTIILSSVLFFTACQKADIQPVASADAKRYALKGKIVSVDKSKKKVSIAHEEIPAFMDAMTMDFPIRDADVLETMSKDAEIKAELIVDKGDYWLENIILTSAPNPNQPALPVDDRFAQIDKEVPDFSLTNQDGKRISINDFRGRALAITFIYSRCPLPEYCILMSKNFSDLAIQLQNNAELKDKIRLLSISFDPATDTPETLKKYGLGYLGKDAKTDFTVWQLATGETKEIRKAADFFGLRYEVDANDKTQFNHSLRTIVIAPDGKVKKVFSGSDWTTDELLREIQATMK
jgi:protein SCO1/2